MQPVLIIAAQFTVAHCSAVGKRVLGARLYQIHTGKHQRQSCPNSRRIGFIQNEFCPKDTEPGNKITDLDCKNRARATDQPDVACVNQRMRNGRRDQGLARDAVQGMRRNPLSGNDCNWQYCHCSDQRRPEKHLYGVESGRSPLGNHVTFHRIAKPGNKSDHHPEYRRIQ